MGGVHVASFLQEMRRQDSARQMNACLEAMRRSVVAPVRPFSQVLLPTKPLTGRDLHEGHRLIPVHDGVDAVAHGLDGRLCVKYVDGGIRSDAVDIYIGLVGAGAGDGRQRYVETLRNVRERNAFA